MFITINGDTHTCKSEYFPEEMLLIEATFRRSEKHKQPPSPKKNRTISWIET